MTQFAFLETKEANSEITRLFEFVWPTAIALWNLRWQVDGFLKAVPEASYSQVASRFVAGSDIHGADIRAMSTRTSWNDQKTIFAEFILTNIFAIYESWARQIYERSVVTGMSDRDLYREGNGTTSGLSAFIGQASLTPSTVMQSAFQPIFLTHKKVYIAQQTDMLKCYKYFKEIRNCQIHNGGRADQKLIDAYDAFHLVSSAHNLKTKEKIEYFAPSLGNKTQVGIRGVVGFCDIVLRLIVTVDAQLSGSQMAEDAAIERIRSVDGGMIRTLKSDKQKADDQVAALCRKASLPTPASVSEVRELLLSKRLVGR